MKAFSQIGEYLSQGGIVMPALAVMAIALWYALGYRFFVLRRPRSLAQCLAEWRARKRVTGSDIVSCATRRVLRLQPDPKVPVEAAINVELFELRQELQSYATWVRGVVVVAPLAGLLGTVGGMIATFAGLGDMALFSAGGGGVAGGISQALFTTQAGLVVAVPGLIAQRRLVRKQRLIETELEGLTQWAVARTAEGQVQHA